MNKAMTMVRGGAQRVYKQAEATVRYVNAVLFKDDRGDTNFVSILILLAIALALASVFMMFRNQIVEYVQKQMGIFEGSYNAQGMGSRVSDNGLSATH